MILGRFLLRLLLVPLGAGIAIWVAVAVVAFAHWSRFAALVAADPGAADNIVIALLVAEPALMLLFAASTMLVPASLGMLISEAFAIRSWMFHAANGGLSAWVGWVGWLTLSEFGPHAEFYDQALIVVGAGIAAGCTYWAVAGWSAGFWKPVFASAASASARRPAAPT